MSGFTVVIQDFGARIEGPTNTPQIKEILKKNGWRWAPSVGCWVIPRNYRPETRDTKISWTVEALGADRVTVEREADDPTDQERHDFLIEQQKASIARNERIADKRGEEADRAWQRSKDAVSGIPFGQPVIAGHHSQRRHAAALKRSRTAADRALAASSDAAEAEQRARTGRARLTQMTSTPAAPTAADIAVGDHVLTDGTWKEVLRVNRKSVTVRHWACENWTELLRLTKVRAVKRDGLTVWTAEVVAR